MSPPVRSPRGKRPADAPRPFLKWAGGKWALAERIAALLPEDLGERTYREPFLGGGALFFWLTTNKPAARYVLSDRLADLIAAYRAVQRRHKKLVASLEALRASHSKEHFYEIRERFNARSGTELDRAAWLIYLNKTCYNGLYRTNRSGIFNVPYGRFENPTIVDRERFAMAAKALREAQLRHASFEHLLEVAESGDVIYLDPPYVPISSTANFAAYSQGAFGPKDQEALAEVFRELDRRGCLLALSNSDAPFVRKLYKDFELTVIEAPRSISSRGTTRQPVAELLVRNAARYPKKPRPRSPKAARPSGE